MYGEDSGSGPSRQGCIGKQHAEVLHYYHRDFKEKLDDFGSEFKWNPVRDPTLEVETVMKGSQHR